MDHLPTFTWMQSDPESERQMELQWSYNGATMELQMELFKFGRSIQVGSVICPLL